MLHTQKRMYLWLTVTSKIYFNPNCVRQSQALKTYYFGIWFSNEYILGKNHILDGWKKYLGDSKIWWKPYRTWKKVWKYTGRFRVIIFSLMWTFWTVRSTSLKDHGGSSPTVNTHIILYSILINIINQWIWTYINSVIQWVF